MVRSLHDKVLPPSLNFKDPNPNVDWDTSPFVVNTELRDWPTPPSGVRRGAVSAFGFGGTNFHVVLEEHVPGRHKPAPRVFAGASVAQPAVGATGRSTVRRGRPDEAAAARCARPRWSRRRRSARAGSQRRSPTRRPVAHRLRRAPTGRSVPLRCVIAVDFADAADLVGKLDKAVKATDQRQPCDLQDAAPAGRVRRAWARAEGGVPVHRAGLAVRQHARRAAGPASRSSPTRSARPTT